MILMRTPHSGGRRCGRPPRRFVLRLRLLGAAEGLLERPAICETRLGRLLLGQRDEVRALGDRRLVVERVAEEGSDLRPAERIPPRVAEEWPRERLVAVVLHRGE